MYSLSINRHAVSAADTIRPNNTLCGTDKVAHASAKLLAVIGCTRSAPSSVVRLTLSSD